MHVLYYSEPHAVVLFGLLSFLSRVTVTKSKGDYSCSTKNVFNNLLFVLKREMETFILQFR